MAAGAVVDAGRVARRDRAAVAERRRQAGQLFDRRTGARMLVFLQDDRIGTALRHADRHDLGRQIAVFLGGDGPRLAARGESVLVLARHLEFLGDILGGLGHRIGAVLLLHHPVDEAPADRRVVDFGLAGEGRIRLAHDERRARHALHAARDGEFRLAGLDGLGADADGVHARSAQPVDPSARYALRQAGQQQAHPGDVAVVLARLVGAAVDHIVDGFGLDRRVARQQFPDRHGAEIVGAHGAQAAAIAADRSADGIADKRLGHGSTPLAATVHRDSGKRRRSGRHIGRIPRFCNPRSRSRSRRRPASSATG